MKTSTSCLPISDTSSSITASADRSTSRTPEASMMTALGWAGEGKDRGGESEPVSRPVSQGRRGGRYPGGKAGQSVQSVGQSVQSVGQSSPSVDPVSTHATMPTTD